MSDYTIEIEDGDPYIIGKDVMVGPMQPVEPGLTGIHCRETWDGHVCAKLKGHDGDHLVCYDDEIIQWTGEIDELDRLP